MSAKTSIMSYSREDCSQLFSKIEPKDQIVAVLEFSLSSANDEAIKAFLDQDLFTHEKNKEKFLEILEVLPKAYTYLPKEVRQRKDKDIIQCYLENSVASIDFASIPLEVWTDSPYFVHYVLDRNPEVLVQFPDVIRQDKEYIRYAVNRITEESGFIEEYLLYRDENGELKAVQDNKEFAFLFLEKNHLWFSHLSDELKEDEDILKFKVRSMDKKPDYSNLDEATRRNPVFLTETLNHFPRVFANLIQNLWSKIGDNEVDKLWDKIVFQFEDKNQTFFKEIFENMEHNDLFMKTLNGNCFNEVLQRLNDENLTILIKQVEIDQKLRISPKFKALEEFILKKKNDKLREDLKKVIPESGNQTQKRKLKYN